MSFTFLLFFIEKDIVISFTSLGRKKERIKVFARIISEFSSSLTYTHTHTHIHTYTHIHTQTHTHTFDGFSSKLTQFATVKRFLSFSL